MKQPILLFTSLCLLCMGGNLKAQTSENKDQKIPLKAYLVSNAHMDTQWNWDVQTTIGEYVWNTINQNLFLMRKYPNYKFNFEGAVKYSWMKEYYPVQYEELKNRVQEGRWHVCGTSWDANDVLIPSSESVIRNILYGQDYYRKEFGVESTDIFLPDCFGFGYNLPTIAHHCGLIGFSSQKLGWRHHAFYEGDRRYPFSMGLWQGIDGQQIMMAHGHNYAHNFEDKDLSTDKELINLAKESTLNTLYRYYGVGDTGGSPSISSARAIEKGLKGKGELRIISATSDQLYKDFANRHAELPVFDGELLMDVHGTGCYTSQAAMKWYNRQNELLGDAAERASVTTEWLQQGNYPQSTLETAWKRILLHHFHDDLTGTSIPRAYEFSWNDELISLKQFSDVLTSSVNRASRLLNTKVSGTPVILYNACGFTVNNLVEMQVSFPKLPKGITVYNEKGEKVLSQYLGYQDGKAHILVNACVPATGYVVYNIRTSGNSTNQTNVVSNTLENSYYKLTLDKKGDIISIYDKINQKEIVQHGKAIRLALFKNNESFEWPAWEIDKHTLDKEPSSITEDVKMTLVENGTLRKSLCVEKRYGESVFRQYIRLYEGACASRIDFYNEINWQSTNALLKAEFPFSVSNSKATYDLSLGSIQRGNNTETAYEVYGHYWADLTDKQGEYGISVLNNGKYGWDKPNDHTLRLTLLHTPKTKNSFTYQNKQDFGYHTFTYSLLPHQGKLNKAIVAYKAEIVNQTLKAFQSEKHDGILGKTFSMVSSNNPNVMIKALKKSINSDEYVVRVYDIAGTGVQNAQLTFAGELISAVEADGTEKAIGSASYSGKILNVSVEPFSLRTYKIRLENPTLIKNKGEYAKIDLTYDRKCASYNEFRNEANFESGYSYAAELLPDSIVADYIPFYLGEPDSFNGLSCKGDTIYLPKGYNQLYFLAATASTKDEPMTITSDKESTKFIIPSYTGFIGQWGHVGHTTGYLKPVQIAYVGTHRHAFDGDRPYEYTYMFKFGMTLPKNARFVVLSKNKNIVLFAVTVTKEKDTIEPASVLFCTNNINNNIGLESKTMHKNLMKGAKIIAYSGKVNEQERPEAAIDGDESTKWCAINTLPAYLEFDLQEEKKLKGWKLVSAGQENNSYITSQCFLMGRNSKDEVWETLDFIDDNKSNITDRPINKEKKYRYLRLSITKGTQTTSSKEARIYELEVY